ncbi:unnamed protein product [Closterium sp. NIES-53]
MRMAGVEYLTVSYITDIIKGLPSSNNLMNRLMVVPGMRESLNKDSLISHILRDKAMQEAKTSTELMLMVIVEEEVDVRSVGCVGSRNNLSFDFLNRTDSDDDGTKGGRGRLAGCSTCRESKPRKEKQSTKPTSPTVSLAPDTNEDFQAVAAAMQVNPAVVLLDSGCSHHLMGTKAAFVDLKPSGDVKHVRGFNGAMQDVQGRGTVALQGESGKQVLIPDVLYVPGVQVNLLSAFPLKESSVKLQDDGDGMLIVLAAGDFLGWATYTGRILITDPHPCSSMLMLTTMETVALWTIVSAAMSTPARWHARLAHVDVDTITSLAKHEVATGLEIKPSAGNNATSPTWLVAERQMKKSVLMLHSDRGGEFLGKEFTDFVDGKGIVHDLTCPYTPQQNGMAEREMRMVVESVRTMLLHMGVQHHWWHLALRQAFWVRNCLERSTLLPETMPHQLRTSKKPNLTLARVWGCMAHFLVPEEQRGGKLKPKARWRLHLSVSEESKGWELLDLTDNKVVNTSDVVCYETMSLEVWKSEHGSASGQMHANPPTDSSTTTLPLLAEFCEPAD